MKRINVFELIIILIFFGLGLGLFKLQIIQGKNYKNLSSKNCIRLLSKAGARGRIFDRDKNVIADNRLSYDLIILPQELEWHDEALREISRILDKNYSSLKSEFQNGRLSSLPFTLAEDIDVKKAIALEELKNRFSGIIIQPQPIRDYPYSRLACHVLGYVSGIDQWRLTKLADYGYDTKDTVGFGGVEEKYDYLLRQDEGGSSMLVDSVGNFIRLLGFKPPSNGMDLELTLQLKIQKIAEDSLSGSKGCVIIMEPYSGEIIAMASYPDFDPSIFISKMNSSIERLLNDPDSPLVNHAISATYPAGSLFKLVVATAALETEKINSSTSFLCEGGLYIGRQKFACWDTHKSQNIVEAIAHSCNVFFFRTGILTGAQAIHDYAMKFGLSKPTNLDLPYEYGGFIPSPLWSKIYKFKKWYDGDTANLSIGQAEVLVTPLQMTRLMAVFANRGFLVTPYILKAAGGKELSKQKRRTVKLNLDEYCMKLINRGLREAISDPGGTANVLSSLPIEIAGKTGTAQAPPGSPHGWFIGYYPYKKPKYVICVFLERGRAGYYSCLVAKRIIEEMLKEGLI